MIIFLFLQCREDTQAPSIYSSFEDYAENGAKQGTSIYGEFVPLDKGKHLPKYVFEQKKFVKVNSIEGKVSCGCVSNYHQLILPGMLPRVQPESTF